MATRTNALANLKSLIGSSDAFIAKMHAAGNAPSGKKTLKRRFTTGEAEEMVHRSRTSLARAELELKLPLARDPETNRRLGYTLDDIQKFREHFGTLPWRDSQRDAPIIVASQNFKGGTSKSTTCILLAHDLAVKGYRVLLVDADNQATCTANCGFVPDRDLTRAHTIYPYLVGEQETLEYAVKQTPWPNIDIIPACLGLSDVEVGGILQLANEPTPQARTEFFRELRRGLETVASNYDVVLIDTPPALGVISLLVLIAADALIVPCTAKMPDFASTVQFFRMILDYIEKIDPEKTFLWIRVLITQFSRRGKHSKNEQTLQEEFVDTMQGIFGDSKFHRVMFEAVEIQTAAAYFMTPYEIEKPNRRVLKQLGSVFEEIELAIQQCWPSKAEALSERGVA